MAIVNSIRGIEGKRGGGGAFDDIPRGLYVLEITSAQVGRSMSGEMKLELTWDVADGPYAHHFDSWGFPPTESLTFSEKAVGFTAHKLRCIGRSNPGMDVESLYEQAMAQPIMWSALIGKRFGALVQVNHYVGKRGKSAGQLKSRNRIVAWYSLDELAAGAWIDSDGKRHEIAVPTGDDWDDDALQLATAQAKDEAPLAQPATAAAPMAEDDIPF